MFLAVAGFVAGAEAVAVAVTAVAVTFCNMLYHAVTEACSLQPAAVTVVCSL